MIQPYVEYIGLLASFTILVALLMTNVKKLRIINLCGGILMICYGFLIGSPSVMIMNTGSAIINITHLIRMSRTKDRFTLMPVEQDDQYLNLYISAHQANLQRITNFNQKDLALSNYRYLILKNLVPVGIFVVKEEKNQQLVILADYVSKQVKDFQVGEFLFSELSKVFKNKGYNQLITTSNDVKHQKYLLKMGFKSISENQSTFIKSL